MHPIKLSLIKPLYSSGLKYQLLSIEITTSDRLIQPLDLTNLTLPETIDPTIGVVISGRAPIWLYGFLVHKLHPTAWVALYDPRLGAVVIVTHSRVAKIGQVIPIDNDTLSEAAKGASLLSPALIIVGPPDSGKSVLAHGLFSSLIPEYPDIYLQRANWDGEGNYLLELKENAFPYGLSEDIYESFKQQNKGSLSETFFEYQKNAILQLRRQKKLVIVDVGGMIQPEKLPLLRVCTHYLIISSQPDLIDSWHQFCQGEGGLTPVAVIKSVLDEQTIVEQDKPFLQMTCGPWIRGRSLSCFPNILLQEVINLIS